MALKGSLCLLLFVGYSGSFEVFVVEGVATGKELLRSFWPRRRGTRNF